MLTRAEISVVGLIFGVLVWGATCSTADAQPQPAPAPQSQPMVFQGVQGMWFPMDAARRLLGDVEELNSLRGQIRLLEEKLQLREETVTLLTQNLDWTEQQAAHWRTALEAALRRQNQRPGFFERPSTNFFLGFVSAGAFSLGLLYGMDHVGS